MNVWLILLCTIIFGIICCFLSVLPWLILEYKCKKQKKLILEEFERNAEIQNEQLQWNSIVKLKVILSSKEKKQPENPKIKKDILEHFLFPEKKLSKNIILKKGYLPHFVKYLQSESPLVQSKAAETLEYIVNELPDEYTEAIAETEIISTLIQNLTSVNENVLDQIILTLATFIHTQSKIRTLFNNSNIIIPLLKIASKEKIFIEDIWSPRLQHIGLIIYYLCQNKNGNSLTEEQENLKIFTVQIIPAMSKFIQIYESQIVLELYQGIFELFANKKTTVSFDKKIIGSCIELLNDLVDDVKISALITLTFISADKNLVQHLMDKGILDNIKAALKFDPDDLERIKTIKTMYGYQILSHLSKENPESIQAIFDANFIPEIIDYLTLEINLAHIAAFNLPLVIAKSGTIKQFSTLIMEFNIMQILCKLLHNPLSKDDTEMHLQLSALLMVNFIFDKISDETVLLEFGKYNVIELIEKFLNHEDQSKRNLAKLICQKNKNLPQSNISNE